MKCFVAVLFLVAVELGSIVVRRLSFFLVVFDQAYLAGASPLIFTSAASISDAEIFSRLLTCSFIIRQYSCTVLMSNGERVTLELLVGIGEARRIF